MLKAIGIPTIAFSKVFLHNIPPVPTSYCSCMLARCISPFEGSPRASAAEYVLGGMLLPSLPPIPTSYCSCMLVRHISPFEGSPRASAAEYVLGGMFPTNLLKNSLSLIPDFQPLNHFPQKKFKKKC